MGEKELVFYLLHLLEHHKVSLPTYRTGRNALGILYRATLDRPEQVARIPIRPGLLRQLADELGFPPAADNIPPSVPNEGSRSAAPTVT